MVEQAPWILVMSSQGTTNAWVAAKTAQNNQIRIVAALRHLFFFHVVVREESAGEMKVSQGAKNSLQ